MSAPLPPKLWLTEVAPRIGAASFITAAVTVERMTSQVVRTSAGRLPSLTPKDRWRTFHRTIGKQTAVVCAQFTGTREVRLALDNVAPPALSIMLACGTVGVPFSSLQYNWAIQDTYRHFQIEPPFVPGLLGFLRQNVAPGVLWAFLRAGCGTGGGLYFGPGIAERVDAAAEAQLGARLPGRASNFLAGLGAGACGSLATQWVHNVTLVAGRMSALGEVHQAPHYTTVAFSAARRELGLGLLYANFGPRMAINAVTVAVLNLCDIFYIPEM
ncbi:unnamed protein product [Effrenium voratum]|nr:unnamed protein product [Effrenium voratum]